jgi:putative DNA primase/helicase
VVSALSADQFERLGSWRFEIAIALFPVGTRTRDEGDERKFSGEGFSINRKTGAWYSFTAGKGGKSPLRLIEFLGGYSRRDAEKWALGFLEKHPGTGAFGNAEDDEDAEAWSAEEAREILANAVDVIGTSGETYLRSRNLDAPFPVKYLLNARCGEGGVVAVLRAHDRDVGVQVTYIDLQGRKSAVVPQRRRFMLEKAPEAAFWMPYTGENTEVIVCEGLEDALSVFRFGRRHDSGGKEHALRCQIIGLPGIGGLRHQRFAKGTRVTVIRDGDPPGSLADLALQAGLDALLLARVDAWVTLTPEGSDANRMLCEHGVKGLSLLIDSVVKAELSIRGKIAELALLDKLTYAQARKKAAKVLGIPVGTLDELVEEARLAAAAQSDFTDIGDTDLWPDAVDGIELLNGLEKIIGEFVVMTLTQRRTVALWTVFTHVFDAALNAPKLWVKSAEPRSGKTRLLEVLKHLVREPLTAEGMTASVMVRLIAKYRPTLLMDECDNWIKEDTDLRKVINSGFDPDGHVWINVPTKDGWEPHPFSTWAPQALAGLGDLHPTNADRSFKIELDRKPRTTKVSRLRRTDIGPLVDLRLKAARWAKDNMDALRDLVPSTPPELNDRAADAWSICIAIADCAGAQWGQWARETAKAISGDDALDSETIGIQLLSDIRNIFLQLPEKDPAKQAVPSHELVGRLLELEDRPWPEFSRGRPLTSPQLARLLRPFHIIPNTIRINSGATGTFKGYRRAQFEKAFERYLPPLRKTPFSDDFSVSPGDPPDFAVTPSQPAENQGFEPDFEPSQEGGCDGSKNPEKPRIAAGCDVVSAENGESREKKEKEPYLNGEDRISPRRPRGAYAKDIKAYAAANPNLEVEKIAKHFGCSRVRVERILGAPHAE